MFELGRRDAGHRSISMAFLPTILKLPHTAQPSILQLVSGFAPTFNLDCRCKTIWLAQTRAMCFISLQFYCRNIDNHAINLAMDKIDNHRTECERWKQRKLHFISSPLLSSTCLIRSRSYWVLLSLSNLKTWLRNLGNSHWVFTSFNAYSNLMP